MESELPKDRLDRLEALDRLDGLEWVDCPECGLPAYVVDRFLRPSTDGPLPHAVTVCARLHHLSTTEESGASESKGSPDGSAEASAEESPQESPQVSPGESASRLDGGTL